MIPNHTQFTAAIQDQKKVCVRFYSIPDSGVLDRVCAPMEYGPGENPDGLNRYWVWDYANETGQPKLGLLPQQIVDLRVLGEVFAPGEFLIGPGAPTKGLPPTATAFSAGQPPAPIL